MIAPTKCLKGTRPGRTSSPLSSSVQAPVERYSDPQVEGPSIGGNLRCRDGAHHSCAQDISCLFKGSSPQPSASQANTRLLFFRAIKRLGKCLWDALAENHALKA
eukprot:3426555-Amphidinium_carterae.1